MTYDVLSPAVARLWPYLPDWSGGFSVTRSFATDIITSRNATEQRRALRPNPRLAVQYRNVVSGDNRRAADQHMRAWQNRPVVVPDFARWARLTGDSSGGASTLDVSPMPAWAAAGQRLVLCGAESEDVLVDSVAGTTITLTDPLVNAWSTGAVLRPTFHGLFDGKIASARLTRDAAEIDVSVTSYPGGEPPRAAGSAWATFNSHEVFTPQPDYAGAPSLSYVWPVEQVDYDRGRTAQFRPIERDARAIEAEFNGQSVAAATALEQFFDRMLGRRGAFYMTMWEQDLILAATASNGSSTIRVAGTAVAELDEFDALAVCLLDGTKIYRLVTAASIVSGTTQLSITGTWPVSLTASNVARISWLPLWRFGSDDMTTQWKTPLAANVRLSFQQVPA